MGVALTVMARLALVRTHRQAGNRHRVAPTHLGPDPNRWTGWLASVSSVFFLLHRQGWWVWALWKPRAVRLSKSLWARSRRP